MLAHDLGSGPFRRACDRCHGQKLRCRREDGASDCLRCQKAGVQCNTTASRSRVRSSRQAQPEGAKKAPVPTLPPSALVPLGPSADTTASSSLHGSYKPNPYAEDHFSTYPCSLLRISGDLDLNPHSLEGSELPRWQGFGSNQWHSSSTYVQRGAQEPPHASMRMPDVPCTENYQSLGPKPTENDSAVQEGGPTTTAGISHRGTVFWVKRLSALNSELQELLTTMPPVTYWLDKANEAVSRTTDPQKASDAEKRLALDQTLCLSREYSEVLNHFFPRFRSSRTYSSDDSVENQLDQSSELLVLSSYLCLVEIYDRILQHFEACAESRSRRHPDEDKDYGLMCIPTLSVGSFSIESSSSTQAVVIMHLMEAMMTRVHDLIEAMAQARRKPGNDEGGIRGGFKVISRSAGAVMDEAEREQWPWNDTSSSVADVTLRAIRSREEATMKFLVTVRTAVFRVGIL